MPSANKTPNYELNQWQGNEYPKRTDFNADNQAIDAALKNLSDGKEALVKNAASKTSIVDADTLPLSDSADAQKTKKITFENLKVTIKSYFDTLFVPLARTVNGKALSSNISLTAGDVGALPTSGGTLTGDLTLSKSTPRMSLVHTGTTRRAIINNDSDGVSCWLNLNASENAGNYLRLNGESVALSDSLLLERVNVARFRIYGEHNITISTAAPGSALAEGAQHQVY